MAESKSIYEKLAEMRVELQAKKLIKTGKNTYSKYEYYELSDFLPSCNSIAAQHKTLFKFAINENTAIKKGFKASKVSQGTEGAFFKLNTRKLDALIKATKADFTRAEHLSLIHI